MYFTYNVKSGKSNRIPPAAPYANVLYSRGTEIVPSDTSLYLFFQHRENNCETFETILGAGGTPSVKCILVYELKPDAAVMPSKPIQIIWPQAFQDTIAYDENRGLPFAKSQDGTRIAFYRYNYDEPDQPRRARIVMYTLKAGQWVIEKTITSEIFPQNWRGLNCKIDSDANFVCSAENENYEYKNYRIASDDGIVRINTTTGAVRTVPLKPADETVATGIMIQDFDLSPKGHLVNSGGWLFTEDAPWNVVSLDGQVLYDYQTDPVRQPLPSYNYFPRQAMFVPGYGGPKFSPGGTWLYAPRSPKILDLFLTQTPYRRHSHLRASDLGLSEIKSVHVDPVTGHLLVCSPRKCVVTEGVQDKATD